MVFVVIKEPDKFQFKAFVSFCIKLFIYSKSLSVEDNLYSFDKLSNKLRAASEGALPILWEFYSVIHTLERSNLFKIIVGKRLRRIDTFFLSRKMKQFL